MYSCAHVPVRQGGKPGVCVGAKINNKGKVCQAHLRTGKFSTQAVQLVINILFCLTSL